MVLTSFTGPSGLSMLKQLLHDGFNATLFERRSSVGGLWSYDADHGWTTAMQFTGANISKYTCGFTDYPIPDSELTLRCSNLLILTRCRISSSPQRRRLSRIYA